MSALPRNDEPGLTRKDELATSGAAISGAPWRAAAGAGAVGTAGDMALHLVGGGIGLSGALSAGAVAFFAVAGAGALLRSNPGRAIRWARTNPWRFAVLPGAAAAVLVFVLSVMIGSSGMLGGAFTALWHGAIVYGLTGAAGAVARSRRR
jgi:hypothetical protein